MKKNNKKGFTIVELVIVIAVIAILAGVLIPTFSTVIKKARINSDTQVVRNLNTSLAADEAINGKPENFNQVMNILSADGYVLANLNPTTTGWYYVWESETNQILLVDENYAIYFKSKDCKTLGSSWYFAVNDATLANQLKNTGANVAFTPKTADDFKNVFQNITSANENQTITITDNITLSGDYFAIGQNANGNNANTTAKVEIDLAGNTVASSGTISQKTALDATLVQGGGSKYFGQLTAMGGELTISNGKVTNNASTPFAISAVDAGKVYVNNVTVEGKPNGTGLAFRVFGNGAEMYIDNCTVVVTAPENGGIECGSGLAVFKNTTIRVDNKNVYNANASNNYINSCFMPSRGGTVIVESGNYYCNSYSVASFATSGGKLVISGGSFTADGNATMFNFYNKGTAAITYGTVDGITQHIVEITGGTFNGKNFADITTEAEWLELCGLTVDEANAAGVTVTIESGKVTIKNINK